MPFGSESCSGSASLPPDPRITPPHAIAMAADPLTPAVSDRICKHMNDDHAEAVLAYARHYGGISGASRARMLAVGPDAMRLEVWHPGRGSLRPQPQRQRRCPPHAGGDAAGPAWERLNQRACLQGSPGSDTFPQPQPRPLCPAVHLATAARPVHRHPLSDLPTAAAGGIGSGPLGLSTLPRAAEPAAARPARPDAVALVGRRPL